MIIPSVHSLYKPSTPNRSLYVMKTCNLWINHSLLCKTNFKFEAQTTTYSKNGNSKHKDLRGTLRNALSHWTDRGSNVREGC
jgi:hypothetical protein